MTIRESLLDLAYESITPPRNHFLYKAHYWPLNDLLSDTAREISVDLFGTQLDVEEEGFLLRLCFSVYRLFEQLMRDLAIYSAVIRYQIDSSRFFTGSEIELESTNASLPREKLAKKLYIDTRGKR